LRAQFRLMTRDRLQVKIWEQNRREHFIRWLKRLLLSAGL